MAMEEDDDLEQEEINSYLTFRVGERVYGIHVHHVVEILAYQQPRTKHEGPEYLLGLFEFRDEVMPLIDCGLKFGQGATRISEQTYILVMRMHPDDEAKRFDVAVAVDEVREVIELDEAQRKQIDSRYRPGYVLFAANTGDHMALIFDPDLVFTDTEIVEMARIAAEAKLDEGK